MSHSLGQILPIQSTNYANICMPLHQYTSQLLKGSFATSKKLSIPAYTTAKDQLTSLPTVTLIGQEIRTTEDPPPGMECSWDPT